MNRRDFIKTTISLGVTTALPFSLPKQAQFHTPKERFSTGITQLDELMDGGIRPGELCVVAATSAGGKTAFCNMVAQTNGIKPMDSSSNDGSNDIIMMHPSGSGIYLPNYKTPINKIANAWEQNTSFIHMMKNLATQLNEAIIWTVPINKPLQAIADSYSFIRHADYYLICNQKKKCVFLIKSRFGYNGIIPIKFINSNDAPVMCSATVA